MVCCNWFIIEFKCHTTSTVKFSKSQQFITGKLYAIGGSRGKSELKSGECFDPETRDWSMISDMSICRSNFDVCVLDGKLFAVGGTDGRHSVESVEAYDPGKSEDFDATTPSLPVSYH
jgi:hypothetical protein